MVMERPALGRPFMLLGLLLIQADEDRGRARSCFVASTSSRSSRSFGIRVT